MTPEYDPERALWISGRRSFLFMAGAAFAGLFAPPAQSLDEMELATATVIPYPIVVNADATITPGPFDPVWPTPEFLDAVQRYYVSTGGPDKPGFFGPSAAYHDAWAQVAGRYLLT